MRNSRALYARTGRTRNGAALFCPAVSLGGNYMPQKPTHNKPNYLFLPGVSQSLFKSLCPPQCASDGVSILILLCGLLVL